ncbi:MAG: helical backbone metal receptor [Ilumatobacteraceae bacterium]
MTANASPRVVSLVPSATETLSAWGVTPMACTRYCERPDLVHVGGTKNPDIDAIIALAPDLVVLDRHENRRPDADALAAAGIELVVLDVNAFTTLNDEMTTLATAVGLPAPAPISPPTPVVDLRAIVPIWRRPWMTIGARTYGSDLLAALGVHNVFADADVNYPEVTIAEMATKKPDVVLIPSEPYVFTDTHLDELTDVAPCVRVDGQDLFWWGDRTAGALTRLASTLTAVASL